MPTITTKDGAQIFYKDWGTGQPVVFSHGWPLNADAWDEQLYFFASNGFRAIAHDRRGHGRSTQTKNGNNMDTYADDLAALTKELDLKNAIHIGHSTGGGEVAHYIGRHGTQASRQSRAGRCRAAAHAEDERQSGRLADRGIRPDSYRRSQRPLAVLQGFRHSVLRSEPARRQDIPGHPGRILAAEHAGRIRGGLRVHQGVLRDRLQRRPQEDRCPDARHTRRRRPDRAVQHCRRKIGEA